MSEVAYGPQYPPSAGSQTTAKQYVDVPQLGQPWISEAAESLERAHEAADRLELVVKGLADRLAPVLAVAGPGTATQTGGFLSLARESQHGERLETLVAKIEDKIILVQAITNMVRL